MKLPKFYILLPFFTLLFGCQPQENNFFSEVYSPDERSVLSNDLDLPDAPMSYGFGNKNIDLALDHKGTFGRVLFYDKNLSSDRSVSCASCHQQARGFADNKAFSHGPNGNFTSRNSIALSSFRSFGRHYDQSLNAETPGLFWDERASSIAEQLRQTINNPNEMGMELAQIVDLVEGTDYYRVLHQKAFETELVTEAQILEALEVFINSISSMNSKFESEILENLNFITGDSVNGIIKNELGFQLFRINCNSCHNLTFGLIDEAETFEQITVANNGLPLAEGDLGVFLHTQDAADQGKFKIPGLLNISLTAPYMHDGRFASLEEVVEHYNSGIDYTPTLHPNLKDGEGAKRLNLTPEEKSALVEFLESLTDNSIATTDKWSNPFKVQ